MPKPFYFSGHVVDCIRDNMIDSMPKPPKQTALKFGIIVSDFFKSTTQFPEFSALQWICIFSQPRHTSRETQQDSKQTMFVLSRLQWSEHPFRCKLFTPRKPPSHASSDQTARKWKWSSRFDLVSVKGKSLYYEWMLPKIPINKKCLPSLKTPDSLLKMSAMRFSAAWSWASACVHYNNKTHVLSHFLSFLKKIFEFQCTLTLILSSDKTFQNKSANLPEVQRNQYLALKLTAVLWLVGGPWFLH